jgi:hypothetical protein
VHLVRDKIALFGQSQAVRPGFGITVFNLLNQSGQPDFKKFIKIVSADREKLQPLEQRIIFVLRFFQHTMIELQPRNFAIDVITRIIDRGACHNEVWESVAKWQAAYGVLIRRRLNKYKAASLLEYQKEFNSKKVKEV